MNFRRTNAPVSGPGKAFMGTMIRGASLSFQTICRKFLLSQREWESHWNENAMRFMERFTNLKSQSPIGAMNRAYSFAISNHLTAIPPLPAGEGRGEGESFERECHAVYGEENRSNKNVLRFKEGPGMPKCDVSAFTLMEVMIAIAVFCIGAFAILGLVASVMRDARLLNKPMVDAGVVASQIAQTNSIVEIQGISGDLSEFLGDNYKGYDYVYGIAEVESNHLYQAEIYVTSDTPGKPVVSKMDVLYFDPLSPPGKLDFGYMQH